MYLNIDVIKQSNAHSDEWMPLIIYGLSRSTKDTTDLNRRKQQKVRTNTRLFEMQTQQSLVWNLLGMKTKQS